MGNHVLKNFKKSGATGIIVPDTVFHGNYLDGEYGGQKYDLLKFILSLFIACYHTDLLPYYLRPIFRIAVPLFFIMSSYFFFVKVKGKDNAYSFDRLLRFVKRNMLLFVFWFFALGWSFWGRFFDNGIIHGCTRVVLWFFLGNVFPASWYISASIIALVCIWALSRIFPDWIIILLSLALYFFASLHSTYDFIGGQLNGFAPQHSFVVAFLWMSIGKCFAWYSIKLTHIGRCILWGGTILLVSLLYLENYLIPFTDNFQSDCYLSLILLCPAIFVLISQYDFKVGKYQLLRKFSTMIYCLNHAIGMTILYHFKSFAFSPVWSFLTISICLVVSVIILNLEKVKGFHWMKYAH